MMNISKILLKSDIPKARKEYISSCVKTFHEKFPNGSAGMYPRTRNKIGLSAHTLAFFCGIGDTIKAFIEGLPFEAINSAIWTKINLDYAIFVNNINKKKAAVFSTFMKNRGITDNKELEYGMKKFLLKIGSFHYPFLHPHRTKRLALNGEYKKSFETGFFYARTDKKNLIDYLIAKFTRQ